MFLNQQGISKKCQNFVILLNGGRMWKTVPAPKFNNITKIEQPKDLQDESEKLNFGRDYQLTL